MSVLTYPEQMELPKLTWREQRAAKKRAVDALRSLDRTLERALQRDTGTLSGENLEHELAGRTDRDREGR